MASESPGPGWINLGTVECEKTDGLAVISQIAFAVMVFLDVPNRLAPNERHEDAIGNSRTRQLVRSFQHDRIIIDCPSLSQPCSLKPADLLNLAGLFVNDRKRCSGFTVILILAFTYKATLPLNHPIPRLVILTSDLLLV